MHRRLPWILLAPIAAFALIAGAVVVVFEPHSDPAVVAAPGATSVVPSPASGDPGSTDPESTDAGPGGLNAEPEVAADPIDPALVAELTSGDAPAAIDSVFFVGPEAAASAEFQDYAEQHELEQTSEGWYAGELTASGIDALGELPDLRVARNEAFQLDPIEPQQSDSVELWDTAVTVPQADPALSAARTSTGKQGSGQVIAIIDSGIDTATPGIGTSKVVKRVDFTSNLWSGCTTSAKDPYGHGTAVSSVAAGASSTAIPGVVGVAPSAKLVDLRVFDCQGASDSFAVGNALTWVRDNHAAYGITVVNLSLGSTTPDTLAGTDAMAVLVNQLVAQGLVVVVAAGNLGDDVSTVSSPGSARFATTVGAAFVNKYGSGPSPYSGFGPVGTRPGIDLVAVGTSLKVAKSTAMKSFPQPTIIASGTSFASPYVAGLAALLRQQNPTLAPSGSVCTISSTCAEGVVLASMTNPIQDLVVTSDWFAPGADATSGAGLVSASASLLHQTVPAATSTTAALAPNTPTWIKLPARSTSNSVSIVLDDNIDILSGDSIDFRWYDANGSNSGISEPCWLSAAGYSSSCSTSGASMWTQRVWNLVAPPSATPVWLRVEANVSRSASISVAGLIEPLSTTSGIRVNDLQLAGDGTGTLRIDRTATSAWANPLTVGPTTGLLFNGAASATVSLGAPSGSFVNVAVSLAPGADFGSVSATRVAIVFDGAPFGVVSVQLPTSGATQGLVIADGKQARGMGINQGADFRITSNGTIAGESYLDYLLRGESSTPGFYAIGLYAVDPGSLAAEPIEIDQTSVTALTFDGISNDGRRVLFRQFPAGSGIVPGDTDGRENFVIYDRDTEHAWEIGTAATEVNSYSGGGLPVISATGQSVAFGQKLSETQLKLWWWGGTNFTDHRELATVTVPQGTDVQIVGVTETRVMYQYWSPSKQAWQIKIQTIGGSSKTITGNTSLRPVMSPDGSAVIVPAQGSSKVSCYRVASGATRTFDGGTYATGQMGVGSDCSFIVGPFDRKSGSFGDFGSKLYKISAGGSKTLLAESRTSKHKWVISGDGSQIATSTGDALVPGDTNGIVDIYRGAWSSTAPSGPIPLISGDPKVGATLAAAAGSWEPTFTALSYQWKRNGASISKATSPTYKLTTSDAGDKITVTVTGKNKGASTTRTSASLTIEKIITSAPTPKISGTNEIGKTLTVTAGTWDPSTITKTYQWKRGGVDIPLAVGKTYVVDPADEGLAITVAVTGSRAGYTTVTKTSSAVTIKRLLTSTPAPTISGIGRSGTVVTATVTPWEPAPVTMSYQWYRSGTTITDATKASYTLTSSDAGKAITVKVTGKKSGYVTVSSTSLPLQVERLFTTAPTPTIGGSAHSGKTLTVATGTWKPTAALSIQWKRDGVDIPEATAATYLLTPDDAGHKVTVSVTATLDGYTPKTRTSASLTIAKLFTATPLPTVTGTPAVGQTLTVVRGTWSTTSITFTYKWLRNGVAISMATSSTYKITAADAGAELTVTVTGKKSGYTTASITSAGVAVPAA